MLFFKENKEAEKRDHNYRIYECEIEHGLIRIIKHKDVDFFSVYAYYDEIDGHGMQGHIEVASHKAHSLPTAKQVAEKLYDIVLGFKTPGPGREY